MSEGPANVPLCTGSGIYCGLIPGHRVTCTDCGKRIKVAKNGFVAEHRAALTEGTDT